MLAYDVEIDGIYYDLTSHSTATVTHDFLSTHMNYYSGNITIPTSITYNGNEYIVTAIGDYAFRHCSELTNVDLPNSITIIKYEAFYGCSSLSSIYIPNSVRTIESEAFRNSGLTSIYIPNSVTSIGYNVLDGTPWYENQPDGVVYLGPFVYSYKGTMPENKKSITIKSGTTGIASGSFEGCTGLTNINLPESLRVIGDDAFGNCD